MIRPFFLLFASTFLFSACSSFFYYPDRTLIFPPSKIGLKEKEIAFKSSDGTQLYGWFFKSLTHGKPKGTIIQFHGNGENMSSHYLSLIWLTKVGYQLFVFDYRGYGKSEGVPSQEGTYLDGLAALDQAWKLHQEKSPKGKFVVYGQSLGGAVAMRSVQDFKQKDKVDLLVMDSTFVSYQRIARRKMQSSWATWLFSPLAWLLVSDSYAAEDALEENKIPLLVIHDDKDPAVPYQCGLDIYEGAHSKKEFWKTSTGKHIAIFESKKEQERFEKYLNGLSTR